MKTYQTMLDLHVKKVIGHVPVDKLDYRLIAYWVKSMMAKGRSPKTIKNVHGLISASMNTAEMLGVHHAEPLPRRAAAERGEGRGRDDVPHPCRVRIDHGRHGGSGTATSPTSWS